MRDFVNEVTGKHIGLRKRSLDLRDVHHRHLISRDSHTQAKVAFLRGLGSGPRLFRMLRRLMSLCGRLRHALGVSEWLRVRSHLVAGCGGGLRAAFFRIGHFRQLGVFHHRLPDICLHQIAL